MGLFGLSPLFFSVVASTFFMDPKTGALDVTHYTMFLALLTGVVYIGGFILLQQLPQTVDIVDNTESQENPTHIGENTPLLAESRSSPTCRPSDPTVSELLRKSDFWLLVLFCVLILGAVSNVISTFDRVLSLFPSPRW